MTTPHLDDEALSAAFDGEASPDEQAHLNGCPHCRDALATLAVVARAVGSPVPPRPEADVAAAISRALADAAGPTAEARMQPGEIAAVSGVAGHLVDQPPPRQAASPGRGPAVRKARPARGRWLGVAGGVAAAVAVVVGLVALLGRTSSRTSTVSSATATTFGGGPLARAADGATAGGAAGVDLGDQSDPAALARAIQNRLSAPSAASAARTAPAPALAPPSSVANGLGGISPPAPLLPSCSAQGPAAAGLAAGASPIFFGSVRWQGQPAVVLVYSRPGGLAGVVMRRADCLRLAVLSF